MPASRQNIDSKYFTRKIFQNNDLEQVRGTVALESSLEKSAGMRSVCGFPVSSVKVVHHNRSIKSVEKCASCIDDQANRAPINTPFSPA